jgi:hypothetical protein
MPSQPKEDVGMKLKYPFITQQVNDGYVAVATDEGAAEFKGIIRLNEVGKEIFDLLSTDQTEELLVAALKERYSDPNDEIESSVRDFVDYLATEGVLEK